MNNKKIAVYLGAHSGISSFYEEVAEKAGSLIAKNGWDLVYGGTNTGLMKTLADAVKKGGAKIIGVVPTFFLYKEEENLDERYAVSSMSERKDKMASLASLFLVLPGGMGTLEEAADIMSWVRLGQAKGKVLFYNENHFYDPLKEQLSLMVKEGFLEQEAMNHLVFVASMTDLDHFLATNSKDSAE